MMRDLYNNLTLSQSVDPATITADTNGASVDLAGYSAAEVIFNFGESGDTLSLRLANVFPGGDVIYQFLFIPVP